MSDENIKVSDSDALAWAKSLSESDQAELKRRALERRAIELMQPVKAPSDAEVASMSDVEFTRYKNSLGIG